MWQDLTNEEKIWAIADSVASGETKTAFSKRMQTHPTTIDRFAKKFTVAKWTLKGVKVGSRARESRYELFCRDEVLVRRIKKWAKDGWGSSYICDFSGLNIRALRYICKKFQIELAARTKRSLSNWVVSERFIENSIKQGKKKAKLIEWQGQMVRIIDHAKTLGISANALRERLKDKERWTVEAAMTTPCLKQRDRKRKYTKPPRDHKWIKQATAEATWRISEKNLRQTYKKSSKSCNEQPH